MPPIRQRRGAVSGMRNQDAVRTMAAWGEREAYWLVKMRDEYSMPHKQIAKKLNRSEQSSRLGLMNTKKKQIGQFGIDLLTFIGKYEAQHPEARFLGPESTLDEILGKVPVPNLRYPVTAADTQGAQALVEFSSSPPQSTISVSSTEEHRRNDSFTSPPWEYKRLSADSRELQPPVQDPSVGRCDCGGITGEMEGDTMESIVKAHGPDNRDTSHMRLLQNFERWRPFAGSE